MVICTEPGCQTTAGCICDRVVRWRPELSRYTDEEIALEHHRRTLKKLGDQSVGVGPVANIHR